LQHRRPDPAGRHMHQHPLAGTGARDAEQHVVGGQVADRYRRGFLEAQPLPWNARSCRWAGVRAFVWRGGTGGGADVRIRYGP
jgi:hypothetical protein